MFAESGGGGQDDILSWSRCWTKGQMVAEIIRDYPLGSMNIHSKFDARLLGRCRAKEQKLTSAHVQTPGVRNIYTRAHALLACALWGTRELVVCQTAAATIVLSAGVSQEVTLTDGLRKTAHLDAHKEPPMI